jgi:hypothetical protein
VLSAHTSLPSATARTRTARPHGPLPSQAAPGPLPPQVAPGPPSQLVVTKPGQLPLPGLVAPPLLDGLARPVAGLPARLLRSSLVLLLPTRSLVPWLVLLLPPVLCSCDLFTALNFKHNVGGGMVEGVIRLAKSILDLGINRYTV